METMMLKKVTEDLEFLKKRVVTLENELKEISSDLHQVKPSYQKKLEKIKKGTFHRYSSIDELRKDIEG